MKLRVIVTFIENVKVIDEAFLLKWRAKTIEGPRNLSARPEQKYRIIFNHEFGPKHLSRFKCTFRFHFGQTLTNAVSWRRIRERLLREQFVNRRDRDSAIAEVLDTGHGGQGNLDRDFNGIVAMGHDGKDFNDDSRVPVTARSEQ